MSMYNERELEDDYPIYAGYIYVADGEPMRSTIETTAKRLKELNNLKSLKNCDMAGRNLLDYAL